MHHNVVVMGIVLESQIFFFFLYNPIIYVKLHNYPFPFPLTSIQKIKLTLISSSFIFISPTSHLRAHFIFHFLDFSFIPSLFSTSNQEGDEGARESSRCCNNYSQLNCNCNLQYDDFDCSIQISSYTSLFFLFIFCFNKTYLENNEKI